MAIWSSDALMLEKFTYN